MQAQSEGSTVVLSDAKEASTLTALLAARTGRAACYASVGELVRTQPLSSVSVLVLRFHEVPKGVVLATLGRMSVEYPEIQKVVVLDAPPPLPIAEYLTACGVSLIWGGNEEDEAERIASVVNQLHERTRWIAS